jgi:hypothetical protein
MKLNNSGSLLNYIKVGSHTTPAEVQKQLVAIDNSSALMMLQIAHKISALLEGGRSTPSNF